MDWSDFGLNVGVEFIGLVIGVPVTIYVIDLLIKKREERRWLGLKLLVKEDVLRTTNGMLTSIRSALRIKAEDVFETDSIDQMVNTEYMNERITHFGNSMIRNFKSHYHKKLFEMDPTDWNKLFRNFANFYDEINIYFSMYASYLEPDVAKHLIIVRNKLSSVHSARSLLPEAFDTPLQQIKNEHKYTAVRNVAVSDIHQLLVNILRLRSYVEKL